MNNLLVTYWLPVVTDYLPVIYQRRMLPY